MFIVAAWFTANIGARAVTGPRPGGGRTATGEPRCAAGVLVLNKLLLTTYSFKFPVFLTACHMLTATVLSRVLTAGFGLSPRESLKSRAQAMKAGKPSRPQPPAVIEFVIAAAAPPAPAPRPPSALPSAPPPLGCAAEPHLLPVRRLRQH